MNILEFWDIVKKKPNVIGVNTVPTKRIKSGQLVDEEVVRVYVREKVKPQALNFGESVPSTLVLDAKFVNTDVLEVGKIRAFQDTARYDPLVAGISVGHIEVTAGTLGYFVYDKDKQIAALSNNHVGANSSSFQHQRARIGDPWLQPGKYDGGNLQDVVALLANFIPLDEVGPNIFGDKAVAYLTNDRKVLADTIADLGTLKIKEFREPSPGDRVIKRGRTSKITNGQVIDTNAIIVVGYGDFNAEMYNCVIVFNEADPINPGTFLLPGDSGSLVFYRDFLGAVLGLGFAGSDKISVIDRMEPGLSKLGFYLTVNGGEPMPKFSGFEREFDIIITPKTVDGEPVFGTELIVEELPSRVLAGDVFYPRFRIVSKDSSVKLPYPIHAAVSFNNYVVTFPTDSDGTLVIVLEAPIVDAEAVYKLNIKFAGI